MVMITPIVIYSDSFVGFCVLSSIISSVYQRKVEMISYLLRLKKLLPTNEIQYDYHHKGNRIFDDCNGEYKFFEFVEPLFQHY